MRSRVISLSKSSPSLPFSSSRGLFCRGLLRACLVASALHAVGSSSFPDPLSVFASDSSVALSLKCCKPFSSNRRRDAAHDTQCLITLSARHPHFVLTDRKAVEDGDGRDPHRNWQSLWTACGSPRRSLSPPVIACRWSEDCRDISSLSSSEPALPFPCCMRVSAQGSRVRLTAEQSAAQRCSRTCSSHAYGSVSVATFSAIKSSTAAIYRVRSARQLFIII